MSGVPPTKERIEKSSGRFTVRGLSKSLLLYFGRSSRVKRLLLRLRVQVPVCLYSRLDPKLEGRDTQT